MTKAKVKAAPKKPKTLADQGKEDVAVTIRLPPALHRKLKTEADKMNVTLSQLMRVKIGS